MKGCGLATTFYERLLWITVPDIRFGTTPYWAQAIKTSDFQKQIPGDITLFLLPEMTFSLKTSSGKTIRDWMDDNRVFSFGLKLKNLKTNETHQLDLAGASLGANKVYKSYLTFFGRPEELDQLEVIFYGWDYGQDSNDHKIIYQTSIQSNIQQLASVIQSWQVMLP